MKKKNQLDSSSVRNVFVNQMTNFIPFPAQKCKHSTMYTHIWYVQTPELTEEFICRITKPGFGYLIKKLGNWLDQIFWEWKVKAALFFFFFCKSERIGNSQLEKINGWRTTAPKYTLYFPLFLKKSLCHIHNECYNRYDSSDRDDRG